MGEYRSLLAPYIQSFLQYREALFHKNTTYEPMLRSFDSFCADNFPGAALLSQEMVWTWMERTSMPRSGRVVNGSVIRKFAIYMNGIGGDAYILPEKMYGSNASFVPYIFTDDELQQLFMEIDAICPSAAQPYKHVVLPVMFRMIYTCGLRPTEARLLRTDNVYLYIWNLVKFSLQAQSETETVSLSCPKICEPSAQTTMSREDFFT